MSKASISEMILVGNVQGKGEIRARVYKHLAPVTISNIKRSVPFAGHVNFFEKSFAYILTPVIVGEEKSKRDFAKGSVAFMPAGCMICFFLNDTRSYKPMNLLGQIDQGLEVLENLRRGDSLRIESILEANSSSSA